MAEEYPLVIVTNADDAHAIADIADLPVTLSRTRGPRLGVTPDPEKKAIP
ncbi:MULTISPECIES: hypothetical protein [Streptomyces aurantiacus group]|uniref:Uncharacterized protein n=1 Tax=Streptomyces flaveus TaxID=66370 RepID=A0A917VNV6_9ACTN|nr:MULTISPECIES: hypothetical protein [Streptomyces]GGL02898.1 hypothetical protein GCM10010094_74600 [Streptomyces flaveus]